MTPMIEQCQPTDFVLDFAELDAEIESIRRVMLMATECGFSDVEATVRADIEATILPPLELLAEAAPTAQDRRGLRERLAAVRAIAAQSVVRP